MFKRMWNELFSGKNIDAYLSISIAVVILVLDTFGMISDKIVQNALLLVLSLIVLGRIADRWFFEDIKLELLGPEFTSWIDFQSEVKSNLLDSKAVWVLGVAPLGFIREFHDELQKICARKGMVRILFVRPDSVAMNLISSKYPEQRGDAIALLDEVKQLRTSLGHNADHLQVKYFDYIPHCIITKVKRDKNETAFVTLNGTGKHGNQRMTIKISASRPNSLAYFTKEVEALWESGEIC